MTVHATTHPHGSLANVACVTAEKAFQILVEKIVRSMGWNLSIVDNFRNLVQRCHESTTNCVIVDMVSSAKPIMTDEHLTNLLVLLPPAIFVVKNGDVDGAISAARAGAVKILQWPCDEGELFKNLQVAVKLDQRSQRIGVDTRFQNTRFGEFSIREKLILGMLVEGMTNSAVADELDISLRTVESERARILKKLGVGSFVEMVRLVAKLDFETQADRINHFERLLAELDKRQ